MMAVATAIAAVVGAERSEDAVIDIFFYFCVLIPLLFFPFFFPFFFGGLNIFVFFFCF